MTDWASLSLAFALSLSFFFSFPLPLLNYHSTSLIHCVTLLLVHVCSVVLLRDSVKLQRQVADILEADGKELHLPDVIAALN